MKDFVVTIADSTEAKYFDRIKAFFNGSQAGGNEPINSDSETFTSVNEILEKDVDTTVDLKATLNSISSNLTSGAELQLYFSTTTTDYDIVGVDSDTAVAFTTSSIDDVSDGLRTFQVANSYPTFAFTGNDATLKFGQNNLYKFTVTANSDDVYLRELTFDVSVSEATTTDGDLQVDSFELLKAGKVVGTASNTPSGAIGATFASETASTTITINNISDYTVASGSSVTFTLRGNVTNVSSDDVNSVSVNLDDSDEDATYNTTSTASGVTGNTVWGDTYEYFNGTYLNYPTDSQTLSL